MTDSYLMLNGEKLELSEDLLKQLTETIKRKRNSFARVGHENIYYFIDPDGSVESAYDLSIDCDAAHHKVANYCSKKELMEQRALHETLDRLLWRFSCENGELENKWDSKNLHYSINWDCMVNDFVIITVQFTHYLSSCFPTKEIARRAIDEIIKPFMAEHPEFVW